MVKDVSLLSLLLLELLLEPVALGYHCGIGDDLHLRRNVRFLLELQVLLLKAGHFALVILHLALGFRLKFLLTL